MNNLRFAAAGLLAGSLALSAGAVAQTTTTSPMNNSAGSSARSTSSKLNSTDKSFMENAAQAGATEIEASKMADSKAMSPDVKSFASTMIQDHTKVAQDLTTLAQSKGYTPPTDPSVVQRTKLKALSATSGASFDKMYASQIAVSAHKDAVALFQKEAKNGKDPEIKAFAQQNLPTLQHHLEMGQALQKAVANEKK
jgi:putative membrane protein